MVVFIVIGFCLVSCFGKSTGTHCIFLGGGIVAFEKSFFFCQLIFDSGTCCVVVVKWLDFNLMKYPPNGAQVTCSLPATPDL